MVSFIPSLLENLHQGADPAYAKKKEESKALVAKVELASVAALVVSVAFGVLGIALTVSGGLSLILGFSIILVTLPAGYLVYNAYKTLENIDDVLDNPKKYQDAFGLTQTFNKELLKAKLKEGTFLFGWFASIAVEKISKGKSGRETGL